MPEEFEFVLIVDDGLGTVRFYFHTHLEAEEAGNTLWEKGILMSIPCGYGYKTWYCVGHKRWIA